MFGQFDSRDEYQPFGYLGRIPLYFTTILVIGYSVFMVLFALLAAANVHEDPARVHDVTRYLIFTSGDVIHGFQFWRLLTYPIVNGPSLWFAVEMYLLYSFGREVERFIGRSAFAMLYFTLVMLGPCLLTAAGPWYVSGLAGSGTVNLAVFFAFATIYPNAEIFFTFKAKWIAAVILGIDSLIMLKDNAMLDLMVFWATSLTAFLFIKYLRGQIQFSLRDYLRLRRSRRSLKPMPSPRTLPPRNTPPPTEDVIESIDPLLDKIAKHGIGSLTPREREKLEHAREELLKKK